MKFKASLDPMARIITVVVVILLLGVGLRSASALWNGGNDSSAIMIHWFIILLDVLILAGAWLWAPQSYALDDQQLIINRAATNKIIRLSDIAEARDLANDEMKGVFRTFGVGGLFGYFGRFYTSKFHDMIWYATQNRNRILVLTRAGQKIIITPDDKGMIDALQQKLLQASVGPQ